ncbi:MAG TPA: endonuclease NucS [Methanofastidiosum sp.]|nr:endonuclease NucS [Methanofastidiosum sp.]
MSKFEFTPEQIEILQSYKNNSLNTEKVKNLRPIQDEAQNECKKILHDIEFINEKDMDSDTFFHLFKKMRILVSNRNLSNLLYRDNIKEFNSHLRYLIHGDEQLFPERIDNFLRLKGMGVHTLSHFLTASDNFKYPIITAQNKEAMNISSEQDEAAREDALSMFNVSADNKYFDRTIEYLRDFIIFQSAKELLNLENYYLLSDILWYGYDEEDGGPEEALKAYGSISIENDLRDFLSMNPSAIEKGFTDVRKEYDTKEVGRIDLLCKDNRGNQVVIELKKGRKNDEVVGQILRYIGWVKKNYGSKVRGIIIVNEPDERLQYAVDAINNLVELKYYVVDFKIKDKY